MNRRTLIAATVATIITGGTTPAARAGWIEDEIVAAANRYGIGADWLLALADCESGMDPNALSNRLNINGTYDCGLFQCNVLTWSWWCEERGITADIWDVYAQCDMTAWAYSVGYGCHWTCAWITGWCA